MIKCSTTVFWNSPHILRQRHWDDFSAAGTNFQTKVTPSAGHLTDLLTCSGHYVRYYGISSCKNTGSEKYCVHAIFFSEFSVILWYLWCRKLQNPHLSISLPYPPPATSSLRLINPGGSDAVVLRDVELTVAIESNIMCSKLICYNVTKCDACKQNLSHKKQHRYECSPFIIVNCYY